MREEFKLIENYLSYWAILILSAIILNLAFISYLNNNIVATRLFLYVGLVLYFLTLIPAFVIGKLDKKVKSKYILLDYIRKKKKNKRGNKK